MVIYIDEEKLTVSYQLERDHAKPGSPSPKHQVGRCRSHQLLHTGLCRISDKEWIEAKFSVEGRFIYWRAALEIGVCEINAIIHCMAHSLGLLLSLSLWSLPVSVSNKLSIKIIIKKNPKKRGEVVKNLVLLGLSFCGELWGTCGKKWRGLWVVGTIRTNRTIVRGRRLQITCTPWCDVYTVTWTSYRNHMIHSLFFIEPFVSHLGINPPLIFPTAKHYIVYPPSNLSTWHHIYSLTRNWPQSDWSLMGLVVSTVFHHLVSSRQIESPAVLISTPCQNF